VSVRAGFTHGPAALCAAAAAAVALAGAATAAAAAPAAHQDGSGTTVSGSWHLAQWQTIGHQSLTCPSGHRYLPGARYGGGSVPNGVEVSAALGGISVVNWEKSHDNGYVSGMANFSMTSLDAFRDGDVTVTLHCTGDASRALR
jgi:hypothetical protein